MAKTSVIVIGAGLGGLSTGIYEQRNGYQCRIFEHARHPGGVASQWKRQGYTIDGGIHFYMGYRPGRPDHDIYRRDPSLLFRLEFGHPFEHYIVSLRHTHVSGKP